MYVKYCDNVGKGSSKRSNFDAVREEKNKTNKNKGHKDTFHADFLGNNKALQESPHVSAQAGALRQGL